MKTADHKHIGRNISRIREMKGMKQATLAELLGVSQQQISMIENSETVDEKRLKSIAEVLEVAPETIKEYSDEKVINYIANFYDQSGSQGQFNGTNTTTTFNPLDKLVEAYEQNKELYERLLQAEKHKLAYLEKLISKAQL